MTRSLPLLLLTLAALMCSYDAHAEKLPDSLRLCVATAAHQIEGGNVHSDWARFEHTEKRIKHGDNADLAIDHWNRLGQDSDLIRDLGVSVYRFSVEWARIEPEAGQFREEALEHYRQEIALLKERGIKPMITLQHFTLPQWVADKGGWEWDEISDRFAAYTQKVYEAIGPDVDEWITINEPMVLLTNGYAFGIFPPLKKDITQIEKPMVNMLRAHGKAYRVLHDKAAAANRKLQVGIAQHLRVFDPRSKYNPLDHFMASLLDKLFNWSFLDAIENGHLKASMPLTFSIDLALTEIKGTQDFIGVNYYTRDMIAFSLFEPTKMKQYVAEGAPVNDLNWEIYPEGFGRLLRAVHQRYPKHTIAITENGIADAKDDRRPEFIKAHLKQVIAAVADGVPISTYCYWTPFDNFEWLEGYEPRFGLYNVDRNNALKRELRPGGVLFQKIAKTREVP